MAVKLTSPLFGYLAKSGTKNSTPQEGDTKLELPGRINSILEIPFPTFQLFTSPLPGGNIPVNSWIYSQEQAFNVVVNAVIAIIGPGVWDLDVLLTLRQVGAISDPTSNIQIFLVDQSSGNTALLCRITNQQVPQLQTAKFRLLSTSDQQFQLAILSAIGLGTALNIAHSRIIATRLF